jgi:hypothetical protein
MSKHKVSNLLVRGNSKVHPKVLMWNIPATLEICGRECAGCYAVSTQKRWPNVKNKWNSNYEVSKTAGFVDRLNTELKFFEGTFSYVRLHGSGEFYSKDYIKKWEEIAKANPQTVFYTYTKRLGEFNFDGLHALPNFVLHNSLLPPYGASNFGEEELMKQQTEKLGGFLCPLSKDREQKCGLECVWCMEKENEGTPILFVKH